MAGIERDRQQPDATTELARGALGVLFVGQSASRVVLRRRIWCEAPWDRRWLDALAESVACVRGIHHPSLLAVLEAQRSPDALVTTTEYVEGITLDTLMLRARERSHRIPVRVALRVAEDLARAIAAAQEQLANRGFNKPLVGLHPECVIVTSGDDALIGDLGVVALEHAPDDPRISRYRAPEVRSGAATPSASVYGLGLLLWELLAGRAADSGTVARLDRVASDVPPLVVELVMQSVSADPKRRFPDPGAFAKALAAAGHRRRPGELVRQLNELATDLLEKQRSVLGSSDVAPTSWRPTMHALDTLPPPAGPRAPKAIGLAAFRKPDPVVEPVPSAAVSSPRSLPIEVEVELPPVTQPEAREPQLTEPLLLVNKPAPPPRVNEQSASTTGSTISFPPDFEIKPRRRWGLTLFVLVVLGGAAAFGVFAIREQLRPKPELALPDPLLPQAEGGVDTGAAAPAGSVAGSRPSKPVATGGRPAGPLPADVPATAPDADAPAQPSAEPSASAAPETPPPQPAPTPAEPDLPDNPYRTAPSAAPPDPKDVFGY